MTDKFEMPAADKKNGPESGIEKAVSEEEFWEERRRAKIGRAASGNETSREAMDRIQREGDAIKAMRAESIKEITDGIKGRLNAWKREDLFRLVSHLDNMGSYLHATFDEGLKELMAKCEEGTEVGRVWRNEKGEERTRISRSPNVAPRALIDRLPWVISHDDTTLKIQAGKVISLAELRDLVKEVLRG